jgi:hypothetical protein
MEKINKYDDKLDEKKDLEALWYKSMVENEKRPVLSQKRLTSVEEEVLKFSIKEGLSVKDISHRRKTNIQNTYKILKNCYKKLSKNNKNMVEKYRYKTSKPIMVEKPHLLKKRDQNQLKKYWRYHNLHFVIKPTFLSPNYHLIRKQYGNYSIKYKGWVIHLNKETVEMQTAKKWDYKSLDLYEATDKAQHHFNMILNLVSKKYGFEVWKEGEANIRLVQHHLARSPSEIANAREGAHLQIRNEKGRVWFVVDKSKVAEHEYIDSNCLQDSEIIEPYFNDWLKNKPPTNSELLQYLTAVARNQDVYNENIKLHLKVIAEMGETMRAIREGLKNVEIH